MRSKIKIPALSLFPHSLSCVVTPGALERVNIADRATGVSSTGVSACVGGMHAVRVERGSETRRPCLCGSVRIQPTAEGV